jgi:hypothetical protein
MKSMVIDWKKLKTPHGPAGNVPTLVKRMTRSKVDNGGEREGALLSLRNALVIEGQWTEVAVPAVELLLAEEPNGLSPSYHLVLLANVISAGCERQWLASERQPIDPIQKQCVALVEAQKELVFNRLGDQNEDNRAAAALLLMVLPSIAHESIPLLAKQYDREQISHVRAGILVALDFLDETGIWGKRTDEIATDGDRDPLVWGAATVCWMRRNRDKSIIEVKDGLAVWLERDWQQAWYLPWRGWTLWWGTSGVTQRLLEWRKESAATLVKLLQVTCQTDPRRPAINVLGGVVGSLLKVDDVKRVLELHELSQEQRALAEALVFTTVFGWPTFMPACGPNQRRWLGLEAPGPLERMIQVKSEGKTLEIPAWKAFEVLREEPGSKLGGKMPVQVWEQYTPLERWQAVLEYVSGAYVKESYIDKEWMEELIGDLNISDELVRIAEQVGETLTTCRPWYKRPQYWTSWLLLLPFVRAKKRIPSTLWEHLYISRNAIDREIALGMPEEGLSSVIAQKLGTTEKTSAMNNVFDVFSVIDLAPTNEACHELVRVIQTFIPEERRDTGFNEQLDACISKVPQLKDAFTRWDEGLKATDEPKPSGTKKKTAGESKPTGTKRKKATQ